MTHRATIIRLGRTRVRLESLLRDEIRYRFGNNARFDRSPLSPPLAQYFDSLEIVVRLSVQLYLFMRIDIREESFNRRLIPCLVNLEDTFNSSFILLN